MESKKWKEKLIAKGNFDPDIWDMIIDLQNAEENRDRFYNHLDAVTRILKISWWDGDFPIDDVKDEIEELYDYRRNN